MQVPLKLFNKVLNHFNGDVTKAKLWFQIDNPVLNGMKPKDYHQRGDYKRLDRMINDALKENNDV